MKIFKLLTLILLFPITIVFADNNVTENKKTEAGFHVAVEGMVTDKITGEALAGVKVIIAETNQFTYTDFYGNFRFDGIAPGKYQLKTSMISYAEETRAVEFSVRKESLEIEITSVN